MKINYPQLATHLSSSLLPVYLLSGDEPFQLQDAVNQIRATAKKQGFTERQILYVVKGFNWADFHTMASSMSLFSEKKIIELRLPSGKPGKEGAKIIQEFCEQVPTDILLLVITAKLEKSSLQTKWVKTINKNGAQLSVWPIEGQQLKHWLQQRLHLRGLTADTDALNLLMDRVAGNLLAADQEIEKLSLLCASGQLDLDTVIQAVADSARYDAFQLVEEALKGEQRHVSRILAGLRSEAVSPILINWALTREIRSLNKMARAVHNGTAIEQIMQQQYVWDKRKPHVRKALQRHSLSSWQALLRRANRIERIIKGFETGNSWDELLQLCLGIAGLRYLPVLPVV